MQDVVVLHLFMLSQIWFQIFSITYCSLESEKKSDKASCSIIDHSGVYHEDHHRHRRHRYQRFCRLCQNSEPYCKHHAATSSWTCRSHLGSVKKEIKMNTNQTKEKLKAAAESAAQWGSGFRTGFLCGAVAALAAALTLTANAQRRWLLSDYAASAA